MMRHAEKRTPLDYVRLSTTGDDLDTVAERRDRLAKPRPAHAYDPTRLVGWPEAGGGCTCWVNPHPFTHYGAVEPGDALAPNPDCPVHFPLIDDNEEDSHHA